MSQPVGSPQSVTDKEPGSCGSGIGTLWRAGTESKLCINHKNW